MTAVDSGPGGQLLTVTGLSKHFAGVRALNDVSFDLRTGEVHALLGENGAGKSTLVKAVSGVLAPDTGEVRLRAQRFAPRDPDESARQGVGVVFQELPLIPDLTVMENVFFNRQPLSALGTVSRPQLRRRTEELFADLGLEGLDPAKMVRDLSVAARQFVAIAKVLADDPAVVVLDEATSALDSESEHLVQEALWRLMENSTALVIAHRLSTIANMDRIVVFDQGRIVEEGTHQELLRQGSSGLYGRLWAHQSGGFLVQG